MHISSIVMDRAIGAVVGSAVADALGAPYEFKPSIPDSQPVVMKAGGAWELGEWTDDTSMAVPILQALAEHRSLNDPATLAEVVAAWQGWARGAKDVGIQTSSVLRRLPSGPSEDDARSAARAVHESKGRSGGNGSLMRTGPVALGYLHDITGMDDAARRVSELTHFEPDNADACVLWCRAIRHAVKHGEYDLAGQLRHLPADRQQLWRDRITEAEAHEPRYFEQQSGWVVGALQAAWSAIVRSDGYRDAIERAVRTGKDTDTVAAIAGALAGARWGYSAIPWALRRDLHGWPGKTGEDLMTLAVRSVQQLGPSHWPLAERQDTQGANRTPVQLPWDDGVWLGDIATLDHLPAGVDAVVTLCRIGTKQRPVPPRDHATFWLVDKHEANPNVAFVLTDAADAIATLRAEGRTVLLHCVHGASRTPSVAAAYAVRHCGIGLSEAMSTLRTTVRGALTRDVFDLPLAEVLPVAP